MTDALKLTDEQIRDMLDKATAGPWRIVDAESMGDRCLTFYKEIWSESTDILVTTEVTRAHNDGGRANMRIIRAAPDLARLALERGVERDAALARAEAAEEKARESALSALQAYGQAETAYDAQKAAEAERDKLLPWAKLGAAVMQDWPDMGDLDGFQLHDMAVSAGVLREIPGGYNPHLHADTVGVIPDRGDPWFEIVARPAAITTQEGGG